MQRLLTTIAVLAILASAGRGETIRGTVIEGNGGAPVPHAEVAFFTDTGGQVVEVVRKETDQEGRFTFSGPFLTPDLTFVLVAMYQGVPYPSSELRAGGQTEILLEVYEPSNDGGKLSIPSHSIIIGTGTAGIEVGHFLQIENSGEHSYVGSGVGVDRRVAEFALPGEVSNLTGTIAAAGGGRYFDNRPLPPGLSQISFNFLLEPESVDQAYPHRAIYATEVLDLYVQPSSTEPGDFFEDLGTTQLHGVEYRHMRATNLQAGQTVLIPVDLPKPVRWMLKWVALAAAGISGALVLTLRSGEWEVPGGSGAGRHPSAADLESLEQHQRDLLRQLATLDDVHEADLDNAAYRTQRAAALSRVLVVRTRLLEADVERRS